MEKRIYHCTKENWYKLKKEIKFLVLGVSMDWNYKKGQKEG